MFEERDEQGPGYDVVVAGIMVEGGMCEGEKGLEDVWLLLNVGGDRREYCGHAFFGGDQLTTAETMKVDEKTKMFHAIFMRV